MTGIGSPATTAALIHRELGYGFSRIEGVNRLALAPDGVSNHLGGSGSRVNIFDGPSDPTLRQAVWPNVISLTTGSSNAVVTAGTILPLSYYHENDAGAATTSFLLDPEKQNASGNWEPDGILIAPLLFGLALSLSKNRRQQASPPPWRA